MNIDSDEAIDSVTGINITNLSMNASNESRDINRWFLFIIRAIMAEIEHNSSMILYEFISIYLVLIDSDSIW
jgi:hypothetical protein